MGIDSQVKILPQVHYSQLQRGSKAITAKSCVYGDGSTSLTTGGVVSHTLALTHAHAYTQAGVYSVTLSVSDGVVTDTLTRTNYLTVSAGIGYTTTTRVITYTYDPLYYMYVLGHPVNLTDPSGKIAHILVAAGIGATGGGVVDGAWALPWI